MVRSICGLSSIFVLSTIIGCNPFVSKQTTGLQDTSSQSNLNLIFKYGVGARNELNTFENTFTKDLIGNPDTTVHLSLSKKELTEIQETMKEINFFDYPDTFVILIPPNKRGCYQEPYDSYYFKVKSDSLIKELWWEDEICEIRDENAENLRELIMFIRNIIESKEEYKKLPEPRGFYG